MMTPMPADMPPKSSRMLVNKLSVDDARHLLRNEGGELTRAELVLQLVAAAVVSAFTARAIWIGNATVWHLTMPMIAQYFALIAALPIIYVVARHPGLRKDAVAALKLWFGLAIALAVAVAVQARNQGVPWRDQLRADAAVAWRWIADAEMHWPILLAALGMLFALPGRVRNLYRYGPPFVGVGLGCAMRLVVLLLGVVLLPWIAGSSTRIAWFLWVMILSSEALALWMHWDIQTKLRQVDQENAA
jgi:hypothetical protein